MAIFYIVKIIFAYIISILSVTIISWIVYPLFYKFLPIDIIRNHKKIFPLILMIFTAISTFLEVVVIIYVFNIFNVGSSYLIVILFIILLLNNTINRIQNIKKDRSPVKFLMISNQDGDLYDKRADLEKEYYCLFGELLGLSGLFII